MHSAIKINTLAGVHATVYSFAYVVHSLSRYISNVYSPRTLSAITRYAAVEPNQ